MTLTAHLKISMSIKAIAFDLDDTLLDTSGLLVPAASRHAFELLQKAGLTLSLDECEKFRLKLIRTISHKDVFKKLAAEYGTEKTLEAVALANKAFYEPVLPAHLPLLPGAKENLEALAKKYHLYVVTAGYQEAQQNKVKSLGIAHFFKKIFVVNSLEKERKLAPFKTILELEHLQPHELLCVGNSLSSEIHDARELGATSCYFQFGEDRGAVPTEPERRPHYHIHNHAELISTCNL